MKELISSILSGRKKRIVTSKTHRRKTKLFTSIKTITRIPFQDESGLCNDLGFLAHLPELCDITFMVGQENFASNTFRLFWTPSAQNFSILHMKKEFILTLQEGGLLKPPLNKIGNLSTF